MKQLKHFDWDKTKKKLNLEFKKWIAILLVWAFFAQAFGS